MLGITLEIASISNQMCKRPSISKSWIWNICYFDRNSRSWIETLECLLELLRFSFKITHLRCQNSKRENANRTCACHVTSSHLVRSYTHAGWTHALYLCAYFLDEKQRGKWTRNMQIFQEQVKNLQRKRAKVLTEKWKILFFAVRFSRSNIIVLFLNLALK